MQFEPEFNRVGLGPVLELWCQKLDEAVIFIEMCSHMPIVTGNAIEYCTLIIERTSYISALAWHFEEDILEVGGVFTTGKGEAAAHATTIHEFSFLERRGEEIYIDEAISIVPEVSGVVRIERLKLVC